MILTKKQLDVLNFVVKDGQAWADHCGNHFGVEKGTPMMLAKVAKYEKEYEASVATGKHKNRKQRDTDEDQKTVDAWATDLAVAKEKHIKELKWWLSNQYIAHVDRHYQKKARLADRELGDYSVPANVCDYEDKLKKVSTDMKTEINAMTDIKTIMNYYPELPEEPKE